MLWIMRHIVSWQWPVKTSRKWADYALHHLTSPGSKCRVNHDKWPRGGRSSDFSPIATAPSR